MVPTTSGGRPPSTSQGPPLKILFDRLGDVPIWHPGDVSIWRPKDVPIWHPEMTSMGRLNLTFQGRPWEVDSGRPQDVLRTSPRGPSEYSNLDIQKFVNFSFRTYSIDQIYLKTFHHSRCNENPVKLLRWSIFSKIS